MDEGNLTELLELLEDTHDEAVDHTLTGVIRLLTVPGMTVDRATAQVRGARDVIRGRRQSAAA
jgi:hypothetical protein